MDSRPDELGWWLLAALLAFLGFGEPWPEPTGWQPHPRLPDVLRVVSWNVGSEVAAEDSALRDEHLAAIARSLHLIDPDLVFLQEVAHFEQVERILRSLRRHDSRRSDWSVVGTRGNGRRTVALGPRERLIGRSGSAANGRPSLEVQFDTGAGRRVVAIVLHAEAFSAAQRNEQIGRASDRLRQLGGDGRILAGDLNLDIDLDKRRDLLTNDVEQDVQTYNYATEHLSDAGLGQGPTAEPDRRLDYLLFDPEAFERVAAGPFRGQRVGDMDHDPLVADLRWRR